MYTAQHTVVFLAVVSNEHQEHSLLASYWVLARKSQDLPYTTVGVPSIESEPGAALCSTSLATSAALRSRCGLLTLCTLGCAAALNGLDGGLDRRCDGLNREAGLDL
jgi:hypothetical protein